MLENRLRIHKLSLSVIMSFLVSISVSNLPSLSTKGWYMLGMKLTAASSIG